MYLGYTTTLASFLSLEFNRLNHPEKSHKTQVAEVMQTFTSSAHDVLTQTCWWTFFFFLQNGQMEREEMKLLSLLLAPVSRIHSYLSHIQVSQQPRRCRSTGNMKEDGSELQPRTRRPTSETHEDV